MGAASGREAVPSAPLDAERDIGAPADEFAMREIGKAQDRIGERDADGAKPDHRAGDQPVDEACAIMAPRFAGCDAEIEFGDERIVGERRGRALVARCCPSTRMTPRCGDGKCGLHVLLDQDDGDAAAVDRLQRWRRPRRRCLRREPGRGLVEDQHLRARR